MAENETEGKKKSNMMLIIILAIVVVLIGGGGTVAFLMLQNKESGEASGDNPQQAQAEEAKLGPMVMLDSFIVNLTGGGGNNYLKIDISLELNNQGLETEITNKMPLVRDTILMLASTKTFEDIQSSQGKIMLKDELQMRLNSFLKTGRIKNIFFTSFIVQ
jgi:flagellar FliL protein